MTADTGDTVPWTDRSSLCLSWICQWRSSWCLCLLPPESLQAAI